MQIKSITQRMILAVLLTGYLSTTVAADTAQATDPRVAKAQQMIAAADQARKKAASVEGEWRDTGKMIKKAQAALKKGDTVTAMKIAAKAHKQGVLGYQQAVAQRELRMPSYLKY